MKSFEFLGRFSFLKTTFRSLRYRNFRLFFGGQSISLIGTWIQRIALPWLVYNLTGSVFLLGVVGFVGQIPTFLLAPYAGVLADRLDRYRIMIITQVLAMVQASILTVLVFTHTVQIWHIIMLSALLGCINAFDVPARQSLMIRMVDRKDDLGNAIALNSSMVNSARLLGPSLAGVLIATTGEGVCFLLNAISYLFVLWSLFLMKLSPNTRNKNNKPVLHEFKEGFRYTFGSLPLKYTILLLALVSLTGMPYTVLMPVFAKEILHGGAHTFGFLMAATGLGALSGALFLASRKNALGLDKIIPAAGALFGAGLILFSFSRNVTLSIIILVFTGLGMMLQMASSNTMLQTLADDEMRGRVMSFYTMAFMGTAPFGSLIAGSSAKVLGAPHTLLIGGVSCIVGVALFIRKIPVITNALHKHYLK